MLVEIASARPNFDPTDNLERGRALLGAIASPEERSKALAEYAKYEIRHGFAYDASDTIERIENPSERFNALCALHEEFVRIEVARYGRPTNS